VDFYISISTAFLSVSIAIHFKFHIAVIITMKFQNTFPLTALLGVASSHTIFTQLTAGGTTNGIFMKTPQIVSQIDQAVQGLELESENLHMMA